MKHFISLHALLCCLFAFIFSDSLGQEEIGLNPPSLKWSQINTPAGRVVFPQGLDTFAFHAAKLMNYQRIHDPSIAGTGRTKRVPVILQNQSILPAGFSTPAPWRNEYYLTPPQNMFLGPIRWEDGMAIHEYRHTQQFYMANQGFTWLYKILMGQTGWLFNSLMTQPLWFREGDAVVGETIFTKGGRGRLPSFHMEYRAMRLAGYHYDYEKAHYASFRDFVPNPYRTGYYMVTKARKDFGETVWTKILSDTYQRKGFFYPFSRSLQKYTGMGTKQFYDETVKELDSIWLRSDSKITERPSRQLSSQPVKYTSYRFPHYLKDGSVLTLKSGLDLINTYYSLSKDREQKLFSPGVYSEDHVTMVVEGNLMTWAESGFHERWINKDYSIIKSYNIETGKISKLSSRSRYFSPAPSKGGEKIIVSESDTGNRYTLILLDATTGIERKRLPNPQNVFFTHMRWEDDRHVIAVTLNDKGNALVRIDTDNGNIEKLLDETAVPLSRPFPSGGYIYFSAGSEGINNIFALNTENKMVYQVTESRFGAFEPVVSHDHTKMLYSEYTADGYMIKEITLEPQSWNETSLKQPGDIKFHLPLLNDEGQDLGELPVSETYPVRKYHALTSGLFNFYGWIPLPNIPEYGLELYTRNLMSTLVGTVGFAYNTNENRGRYYARLTYAALYPHLLVNLNSGLRRSANILPASSPDEYYEQEWREKSVSAGLRFPFRLTQGTHPTRLSLAGFYEYYDVSALDSADLTIETERSSFHGIKGELIFTRNQIQARQHVKPRWGQELTINYNKAFDSTPEKLFALSYLFFPGMFRTHSLNFRMEYKREEVMDTYRYIDDFIMPRGYEPMPYKELYVASVNYELPVWYPDIPAGSVAFFQRLRANFFLDRAEGNTGTFSQPMTSTGAELFIDLRLFRLFQMTMAFRYNYTFDDPVAGTIPFQFLITRFELAN